MIRDISISAIYLPQFHRTEYNDKWWGEGYTEWTACRAAKPLFKGHRQPREPLDDNYYDLSRIDDIKKQVAIAKKFGIDSFGIYQYYSCGNKLLDTPVEILFSNKNIKMNFYFIWANHDWRKNWFGQNKTIIWPQKYGNDLDCKEHYRYCRKFFLDDRYVKIDNKPVFFVYQEWEIPRVDEYIEIWNSLAKKDGFDGIYFVKNVTARNSCKLGKFNAVFERQPFFEMSKGEKIFEKYFRLISSRIYEITNRHKITKKVLWVKDYKKVCKRIIDMKPSAGENTILGVFPGWDNTPRKQYSGSYFINESADTFQECLEGQIKKAKKYNCKMIVINAWNEWAEGMYLEPDKDNKYEYLNAVKNAKELEKLL